MKKSFNMEKLETLMHTKHSPGVYEALKKKKVGIIGVGGLGSHVAVALARTGVGQLILADFDNVEPSNINRQYYGIADLGKPKTEAIKVIINHLNPFIEVVAKQVKITDDNLVDIFKDCDVLVEAVDTVESKILIVNTALEYLSMPLVAASGLAGNLSANEIITKKINHRFYIVGDQKTEASYKQGLMAPRVMVSAGHQANITVRLLLGEEANIC